MPPQSFTHAAFEKYLYGNIKNKSKKRFKMIPYVPISGHFCEEHLSPCAKRRAIDDIPQTHLDRKVVYYLLFFSIACPLFPREYR
jgi:hypothetical protein